MDLIIFKTINQFANQWICLDTFAIFFAGYFEYFLIFCLLLFLLINFKKYWLMIFQAFVAGVFARLFVVEIIRYFFPKDRPFVHLDVNLLLNHSTANSFPSGHAAFYFAISMVIFLYLKKNQSLLKYWQGISIFFFISSFLISISRVFVGIHWPADILSGAMVGILSGWFIVYLFQKFFLIVLKRLPLLR